MQPNACVLSWKAVHQVSLEALTCIQKCIMQPDMTSSVDTIAQYSLLSGPARPRTVIIEWYETVT